MKKLLKTGGWIIFCFKMQLNHQTPSLPLLSWKTSLPPWQKTEGLFSGDVVLCVSGLRILGPFEGREILLQIEMITFVLNVGCLVPVFLHLVFKTLGAWLILFLTE